MLSTTRRRRRDPPRAWARQAKSRRVHRAKLGVAAVGLLASAALLAAPEEEAVRKVAASGATASNVLALAGERSPNAWHEAKDTQVVVALFSLPGCPYCEIVRRNYLRHLVGQVPGLRVVEYGLDDDRPFRDPPRHAEAPRSAAALARSLGVRFAPTVVFLGDDGEELAQRLVGYNSPDFYGAYLEQGITHALERARGQ